jgi:2-keto-4-pentenoate hydratase/2-oxohepta-3-ene-1,7-dioic acid hydratase in catechol pathway
MEAVFGGSNARLAQTTFGRAFPVERIYASNATRLAEGVITDVIAGTSVNIDVEADSATARAIIAIAIGEAGESINKDRAFMHIWGYAAGLEISSRSETSGKGRRIFAIGPISPADETGMMTHSKTKFFCDAALVREGSLRLLTEQIGCDLQRLSQKSPLNRGDIIVLPLFDHCDAVKKGVVCRCEIDRLAPIEATLVDHGDQPAA